MTISIVFAAALVVTLLASCFVDRFAGAMPVEVPVGYQSPAQRLLTALSNAYDNDSSELRTCIGFAVPTVTMAIIAWNNLDPNYMGITTLFASFCTVVAALPVLASIVTILDHRDWTAPVDLPARNELQPTLELNAYIAQFA